MIIQHKFEVNFVQDKHFKSGLFCLIERSLMEMKTFVKPHSAKYNLNKNDSPQAQV